MRLAAAAAALLTASTLALPTAAQSPLPVPPTAPWQSPLDQDHPLVGTFWSTATGDRLTPAEVLDRAMDSRVVILGERHDNADHHALQAWLTRSMVAQGRRPAVVYEMMETDEQAAIDTWRAEGPADADGLGAVLQWETSGWPAWSLYAPMADAALKHGLPILAGNLPQDSVRRLARTGIAGLAAQVAAELRLAAPDVPAVRDGLTEDVRAGHCGLMPEAMLAPMALVQRARDASMAAEVLRGLRNPATDAAVLITGNGHAREDRGVPLRLSAHGVPPDEILTVAPLEVLSDLTDPGAYMETSETADRPIYDIVWFSPRADATDHCAALRERMKNGKQ